MNKRSTKPILLGLALPLLMLVDGAPDAPTGLGLVRDANAVFGRPLTPASYAGVARRTTRRAVAVTSTAAATSAAAASSTTATTTYQQPAPAPAAQPTGAPPIGSIVTTLPAGCQSTPSGGIEYYTCNGTRYRPAFQGNNLVYVVQ
jgi:hypothetical protein